MANLVQGKTYGGREEGGDPNHQKRYKIIVTTLTQIASFVFIFVQTMYIGCSILLRTIISSSLTLELCWLDAIAAVLRIGGGD